MGHLETTLRRLTMAAFLASAFIVGASTGFAVFARFVLAPAPVAAAPPIAAPTTDRAFVAMVRQALDPSRGG